MRNIIASALFAMMALSGYASMAQADGDTGGRQTATLWWVIFNHPEHCVTNPGGPERCGAIDIFGQAYLESVAQGAPDPGLIRPNLASGVGVLYASGDSSTRRGKLRFVTSIYRSAPGGQLDLSASPTLVDPMGLGTGLENPDAEVHLVVRTHGRLVRDGEFAQITGFLEPYCSDPNLLFFSGANICADVQFAVFAPGEAGERPVFAFGEPPRRVRGASAQLVRNGDALQAVVTTRFRKSRHDR